MFVCNYDRKNFIDDHRQKYVEITKNCLGIEIADESLRFLQTKHLQCDQNVSFFARDCTLIWLKNRRDFLNLPMKRPKIGGAEANPSLFVVTSLY